MTAQFKAQEDQLAPFQKQEVYSPSNEAETIAHACMT